MILYYLNFIIVQYPGSTYMNSHTVYIHVCINNLLLCYMYVTSWVCITFVHV